jgi:hypothetical protein
MEKRATAEQFERRLWRPMFHTVEITEDGLVMGAGTVLARMKRDASGAQVPALDEDRARVFALLAAAYGRAPQPDLSDHLVSAARFWKRGDKALANIRLAFAHLPPLKSRDDAYRLFLAECLLDDDGLSPDALMKVMGLRPTPSDLAKFNSDQPRVPPGSGRTSGQWTGGGAAQPRPATTPVPAVSAAALALPSVGSAGADALFSTTARSLFLAGIGVLAETLGVAAVLGLIFVPNPNGHVSEGAVPGNPDLSYSLNNDEGALRFMRQTGSGSETVVVAHQGRDGVFFELETYTPIARTVGGSLVIDAASLAQVVDGTSVRSNAETAADAQSRNDEPHLCPDPSPDVPHGASVRAIAYQSQISAMNNPQRPLPPGLAVSLTDLTTGKNVVFDDCRENDGTMIEAKGPGYAEMMAKAPFYREVFSADWQKQAESQIAASGGREIEWFFAEPEAADLARDVFAASVTLRRVKILDVPPAIP